MCNFLSGSVDFTEESVGLMAACLAGYRIGTAFRESCTSRNNSIAERNQLNYEETLPFSIAIMKRRVLYSEANYPVIVRDKG
jgi:hypothetical protein